MCFVVKGLSIGVEKRRENADKKESKAAF